MWGRASRGNAAKKRSEGSRIEVVERGKRGKIITSAEKVTHDTATKVVQTLLCLVELCGIGSVRSRNKVVVEAEDIEEIVRPER